MNDEIYWRQCTEIGLFLFTFKMYLNNFKLLDFLFY